MSKWKNAAGVSSPAASEKPNQTGYIVKSAKNKEEIHRTPIRLHRHPDALPSTLKQLNQWCLSGQDKTPLGIDGFPVDVTDPINWVSFDEAIAASTNVTCAGVGFILTPADNIVVVDVDHCIDEDGSYTDIAAELLELLPTYTEFSQSKTGLHFVYHDNNVPAEFTGRKGLVEIYYSKRYFALTGWKITGSTTDLTVLNGMTKRLLNTYFPNTGYTSSADFQTVLEQHSYPPIQSNEAVLQSLHSNQKFRRLYYDGNITGYPSQSEADGALMLLLATATSLNADQMRRLFSQSALGQRDKWVNRVWYQDYLITGAIQFAEKEEDIMNDDNMKLSDYDQLLFESEQNDYICQSARRTGFSTLDKYMGFPPGVYCLAAINSAGKTAFSIQLGHQLAQQGESVVIVGYEITALEVYSRILARYMRLLNPQSPFSAYDVRTNVCKDDPYYQSARNSIRQSCFNLRIWKTTPQDNVDRLIIRLRNFLSVHPNEKPPVIILDYLQIIPHTGDLKRMIDEELPKIKMFQQSTGTTFLIISSANRASYRHDMGVEAFKESGVIEFSADVIWMLQYSALNSISTMDNTRLKIEKARSPRKMTLKCLKNRFGSDYEVQFDYYSKFDLFVESSERLYNTDDYVNSTVQHTSYAARRKIHHDNIDNQNADN